MTIITPGLNLLNETKKGIIHSTFYAKSQLGNRDTQIEQVPVHSDSGNLKQNQI